MPTKRSHERNTKSPRVRRGQTAISLTVFTDIARELGFSTACLIHVMEEKWGLAHFDSGNVVFHKPQRTIHKGRSALNNKEPRHGDR